MKSIFVCVPNRYATQAQKLSERLQELGFKVRYAAKDTPQNISDKEIFNSNLNLIKHSDIFLAYFVEDGHYGIDFASEVGIASQIGKLVVGYVEISNNKLKEFKQNLKKDVMFTNLFDSILYKFDELIEVLNKFKSS